MFNGGDCLVATQSLRFPLWYATPSFVFNTYLCQTLLLGIVKGWVLLKSMWPNFACYPGWKVVQ
eukprot:5539738-Amphidinium_carterae.1